MVFGMLMCTGLDILPRFDFNWPCTCHLAAPLSTAWQSFIRMWKDFHPSALTHTSNKTIAPPRTPIGHPDGLIYSLSDVSTVRDVRMAAASTASHVRCTWNFSNRRSSWKRVSLWGAELYFLLYIQTVPPSEPWPSLSSVLLRHVELSPQAIKYELPPFSTTTTRS